MPVKHDRAIFHAPAVASGGNIRPWLYKSAFRFNANEAKGNEARKIEFEINTKVCVLM